MTKRDFFRIIIKIFGLYSLILALFYYIPSNIGFMIYEITPLILIGLCVVIFLLVLIFAFLIRKTDKVIDILKLDTGFDSPRIELGNLSGLDIMKFALIVIGGFLMIDYLPEFLQYCYLAFKSKVSRNGINPVLDEFSYGNSVDYFQWVVSGLNLLLGYILLTNYSRIAKWLTRKENSTGQQHV